MRVENEINRRYVPLPPGPPPAATSPAENRGSRFAVVRWLERMLRGWAHRAVGSGRRLLSPALTEATRLLLLPVLIVVAVVMVLYLRIFLWRRLPAGSTLHRQAIDNVDLFVRQYPLHLYPILCKALEMAVLRAELANLPEHRQRILEVAIGDGTLSARVFPPGAEVIGLDLNPYYLHHARQMTHVREAIVCDCMEPPLHEGSFDLIVANNFLHHVTEKAKPLAAWSRIAEKAVFNENTIFWASGWVAPYVLTRLRLRGAASRVLRRIERNHWQALLEMEQLNSVVREHYEIVRAASYLSERTFFLCAIFSCFMRCTGPPTPRMLKRLFLGPLRRITLPLTERLARLLLQFDELQDRSRDAYVSYSCRGRAFARSGDACYLICPNCRAGLNISNRCGKCGAEYRRTDGMLFLLAPELDHIRLSYSADVAAALDKELL